MCELFGVIDRCQDEAVEELQLTNLDFSVCPFRGSGLLVGCCIMLQQARAPPLFHSLSIDTQPQPAPQNIRTQAKNLAGVGIASEITKQRHVPDFRHRKHAAGRRQESVLPCF